MEVDSDNSLPSTSAAVQTANVFSRTSTAADEQLELSLVNPERRCISYRQMITDILQGLRDEIQDDWMPDIQLKCLAAGFDVDMTELFSTKTMMDLFRLLLSKNKGSFNSIVLLMNEVIPKIVADIHVVLDSLKWLSDHINQDMEYLGISSNSVLHGRQEKIQELGRVMDFENKAEQKTKLINVCGMTGIGKSHLVKHLALRLLNDGNNAVLYVDASGVSQLPDLLVKILQRMSLPISEKSEEELKGALNKFIESSGALVMIIDDLSEMMNSSDVTLKTLTFLNDLIKYSTVRTHKKSKLKIMITSQQQLKENPRSQDKKLQILLGDVAVYTKDVRLYPLDSEESRQLLPANLQSLSDEQMDSLIKACGGHPLTLDYVSRVASQDFSLTTEIHTPTSGEYDDVISLTTEKIFFGIFTKMSELERHVLFAVSLFEKDVSLEILYKIVSPNTSAKLFREDVKRKFQDNFWLNFRVSQIKSEAERRTLVSFHHPLIRKFITDRAVTDPAAHIQKLKEKFIFHHISELVDIGKACVPENPHLTEFAKTNTKFMDIRANVTSSLSLLMESENPYNIFSSDGIKLRPSTDIIYLYLCVNEYYQGLSGILRKSIDEIRMRVLENPSVTAELRKAHPVLMWTLYLTILVQEKDWDTLNAAYNNPLPVDAKPSQIAGVSEDLFFFCKSVQSYCQGMLYRHHPGFIQTTDTHIIESRINLFENAQKDLSRDNLPAASLQARSYFSIHTSIGLAEATFLKNMGSIDVIKQSQRICRAALKRTDQIPILKPSVCTWIAVYKSIEGDRIEDVKGATAIYNESRLRFETALKYFGQQGIKYSSTFVWCLDRFGILRRSWASLLLDELNLHGLEKYRPHIIDNLKHAVALSKQSAELYRVMNSENKMSLWKTTYDVADILERLQFATPVNENAARCQYQSEARVWYQEAYDILRRHYRQCYLPPDDPTFKAMMSRLPELMQMHGEPKERIDKVKYNFRDIQSKIRKYAENPVMDSSGSDSPISSDPESPSSDEDKFRLNADLSPNYALLQAPAAVTSVISDRHETLPVQVMDTDEGHLHQPASESHDNELKTGGKKRKL